MASKKRTKKRAAKKKELPDIVKAACVTKQIDPAKVTVFLVSGSDIFITATGRGQVRVEISALPESVVEAYYKAKRQPQPDGAVAQAETLPDVA